MQNYFVSIDLRKLGDAELSEFFESLEKIRKTAKKVGYKLVMRPKPTCLGKKA